MVQSEVKPATIGNISATQTSTELATMVNQWLEEEDLPLQSWDEIETTEPYHQEILRVAIQRWDELTEKEATEGVA